VVWGSDGSHYEAIRMLTDTHAIAQDGQTVYRWATSTIGEVCRQACADAGVAVADLAAFIPHQANLRIIELIAKKLGITEDSPTVIARDVMVSGNTSAASIPLAMSKMVQRGEIASGAPVLVVGFGAGLTYAAQVVLAP
jgi:3-oxoacyl-[acyl-carrier-protein] synthase-3